MTTQAGWISPTGTGPLNIICILDKGEHRSGLRYPNDAYPCRSPS